uniref:Uncharacterized protein n=1 Tax=Buteo japonicus TaxID=224669 RepID=A0A8C0BZA2_9AVES
ACSAFERSISVLFPLEVADYLLRGKETSLVREGREREEAGDSQREFEEHNSSTWLSLNIRLWRRYQLLPTPMPPFLFVLSLPRA